MTETKMLTEHQKKNISVDGRMSIEIPSGKVHVYDTEEETFNRLKQIGHYDTSEGLEWVYYTGITFFKKRSR